MNSTRFSMLEPQFVQRINSISEKAIGCAYKVSNCLGNGFLEKVYENALAYELQKAGLKANQQRPLQVFYDGIVVGEFFTDILVEDLVILEIKAVKALNEIHMAQGINYLKATELPLCLLINFGKPRVEIKRIVR